MVAEIIINSVAKELNKNFDYIIPENLISKIKIGSRVFVPFGRQKKEEGYVINIKETSEFANKEIISIEDNLLDEEKMNLAKLMAKRYFCNISDCVKLMLPPGSKSKKIESRVKEKKALFVSLLKTEEEIEELIRTKQIKSEKQQRVMNFLKQNNEIYIADLEAITDVSRATIKTLEKKEYLKIEEKNIKRNPFINKEIKKDEALKLTVEQQNAFNSINNSRYKEFLLYGVTGSRKNRNLSSINRFCTRTRKNSNCTCSRNSVNTTNGRKIFK